MTAAEDVVGRRRGTGRRTMSVGPIVGRYLHSLNSTQGRVGLTLLAVVVLVVIATPLLFPGGYDEQSARSLAAPSPGALFGTDEVGRSILVRALYGVRTDLGLVAIAVPLSAVIGTLLGLVGIIHPLLGTVAQRVLDVIVGFPSLILGISVALVLSPGWTALLVALTIYGIPQFGRLARATLVAQQHRDYVYAARMLGVSRARIMVRHVLPHTTSTAITQCVAAAVAAIFLECSLSLVGLGIQPPQPSLGVLLNNGSRFLEQQVWYVLGPAAVLFVLVLGLTLVAGALTRENGHD